MDQGQLMGPSGGRDTIIACTKLGNGGSAAPTPYPVGKELKELALVSGSHIYPTSLSPLPSGRHVH
jgi:hypothetical protein